MFVMDFREYLVVIGFAFGFGILFLVGFLGVYLCVCSSLGVGGRCLRSGYRL